MKSKEIRESFIKFFEGKNHHKISSAPVLPYDDKSLLFTNAGMNQFKPIFLDTEKPKHLRVVNSQKCIRVSGKHNDLEEVGRDGFHHTFFEMLGNWSFGDYYKKEAIEWSWELLTDVWGLDKSRLWVTVFHDDDEAYDLWEKETDIDKSRIVRCGAKDNFWEMAETGPCGPCSEIHYYVGDDIDNQQAKYVNNSDEYWELWNLVFIQSNRLKDGTFEDLPKKHVDTGAGLERICSVLQNKNSNYKNDLFSKTISDLEKISKTSYQHHEVSYNVICDHIRMLSFAIADGVLPSNEGRGYVVRRVLRRGSRFAMNLNSNEPILYKLVQSVVSTMSDTYPELKDKQRHIEKTIFNEEQSFLTTLEKGIIQFEKIIKQSSSDSISGADAFKLYDTYGFPLDLTELMASEKEKTVDIEGFEEEMNKQKDLAKKNQKFVMDSEDIQWKFVNNSPHSNFIGYSENESSSKIVNWADNDSNIYIILDQTPFYAESGGQIGDTGIIENKDFSAEVVDTQKNGDFIIHICNLKKGTISKDMNISCKIDLARRNNIRVNHSATHLLHQSLKDILGDHVNQAGSLVHPDYLRLDITHPSKIDKKNMDAIELLVNEKIAENISVQTNIKALEDAKKEGATALFGEKYGEEVRVLTMGSFSKELCGGTHVSATGEINEFMITYEKAIASGVRRVHAITGKHVKLHIQDRMNTMNSLQEANDQKELEKQNQSNMLNAIHIDKIIENQTHLNDIAFINEEVALGSIADLKKLNTKLSTKFTSGIAVFSVMINEKAVISVSVSKDLIEKSVSASSLAKLIGKALNGGGGGRDDFATAGASSDFSLTEIKNKINKLITSQMEKL